MMYTNLPNTDIEVSKICLGTMTWGNQNTQNEAFQQMDHALYEGINFFDTAELYPIPAHPDRHSHTEIIIGNWFKERKNREEVVLASKIVGKAAHTKFIREDGINRESLIEAVENSLIRLQTDYIDLYQLHWPDRNTNYFGKRGYTYDSHDHWEDNIHQILETLQALIRQGKIRHIGLSNETPWGVMRFLEESKVHRLPRIRTVQNPFSLLNRLYEVGLAEISHREHVGLLAYSPLGFGTLSGKYLGGRMPKNSRLALFSQYDRYSAETAIAATTRYEKLARENGLSPAQMALAFVNSRPFVTSTIIGATSMEQLKENMASFDVVLSEEVLKGIEQIHNSIPNPAP